MSIKRKAVLIMLILALGCKSKKPFTHSKKTTPIESKTEAKRHFSKIESIIHYAQSFEGTPYKFGGATKKGMDCSGLVFKAFNDNGISLARTTKDLSNKGIWIDIKEIEPGDLVFFATRKNSRSINHVGLVTATENNTIQFIHSTSSKGVITSSLKEKYWYFAYVQARRVL